MINNYQLDIWLKSDSYEHIDEQSKSLWESYTKTPWVLDPNDDSDFILVCPWCDNPNSVKW